MPARKKTLLDLVEDGTFLGRKDWPLLDDDDEPALPWKSLEKIRQAFRDAGSDFERVRHRLEFEKAIPKLHARRERAAKPLDESLAALGPEGSAEQLLAFFPKFLGWPDGSRFRLDPYQREIIELGWRRDKQGRRVFQEIGTGIPRGNGKTPFWAGIGLCTMLGAPGRPKILQVSGDKAQARLGLGYLTDWTEDNEQLRRWLRWSANRVRRRDGRGEYAVMATSGGGAHGRKGRIGLVDEFWTIETLPQEKTVTAIETAAFKEAHLGGFWGWISTAGYLKDSMLGRAYDSALKLPHVEHLDDGFHIRAWDEDAGRLMLWWGLPEGYELDLENDREMLRVIRLTNPLRYIDPVQILRAGKRAAQKGELEFNEWIRFNLNGWTKTKAGWLPTGAFRKLRVEQPIPDGAEIFVAVDAAHKYDTTAVVWAARVDGRIRLQGRAWAAREDAPAHVFVHGGRIDNRLAAAFILHDLGQRYRIREVVGDPNPFEPFLWELGEQGLVTAPFQQNGSEMRDAEQHFYEAATAGTISWYDPLGIFAQHVDAAAAVASGSRGVRVINPDKRNPIDLLTAAIMAVRRCALGDRREVSVYEKRGLDVLTGPTRKSVGDGDGDSDQDGTREAIPYSAELAELLGLSVDDEDEDEEFDIDDDLEDDDEWS